MATPVVTFSTPAVENVTPPRSRVTSRRAIDRQVTAGRLVPYHRGVVAIAGAPRRRCCGSLPTRSALERAMLRLIRDAGLPRPLVDAAIAGWTVVRFTARQLQQRPTSSPPSSPPCSAAATGDQAAHDDVPAGRQAVRGGILALAFLLPPARDTMGGVVPMLAAAVIAVAIAACGEGGGPAQTGLAKPPRATLVPAGTHPLRIKGSGFAPRERVRVTVTPLASDPIVSRVHANAHGSFVLTLRSVDAEGGLEGVAAGGAGSHASFQFSS